MWCINRNLHWIIIVLLVALGLIVIVVDIVRLNCRMHEFNNMPQQSGSTPKEFASLYQNQLALAVAPLTNSTNTSTPSQRLKALLNCSDRHLEMETIQHGDFWLLRNFISGTLSQNMSCAESITYTTHGDYTFLKSLGPLVSRWRAPISLALYTPGNDMDATIDSIQFVRNCMLESELIRQYVSFHIYFPGKHMPSYISLNEAAAFARHHRCFMDVPPYKNVDTRQLYRSKHNLTYPINVGRNIARKAANTHFIFACDLEMLPSVGLVPKFLQLMASDKRLIPSAEKLRVFAMPVFELAANASIPDSKTQLMEMIDTKSAITFHSNFCRLCHTVPQELEWLKASDTSVLSVFTSTKRQALFKFWEPFYISDNREPLFDERVTWEGQSNKRIQGYAMCLLGYDYYLLHPAFLVHSPGIKQYDPSSYRAKFVPKMNYRIHFTIIPQYLVLYGNNTKCQV